MILYTQHTEQMATAKGLMRSQPLPTRQMRNNRATDKPIPLAPPVTSAVLPVS